jgi:hypothetical protein
MESGFILMPYIFNIHTMAARAQKEFVFVNFLPIFKKNFVSSKKVRNIVL